jgi:hypothetical protein
VTTSERIISPGGIIIAIVVKADYAKNGVNFLSNEDFPLQLGVSCYKQGDKIKPHLHIDKQLLINKIQEIVHLEKGKTNVSLYDINGEELESIELSKGDTIFFIDGGHGFTMLEDTKLIEVKQGPYFGKEKDKLMLE